MLPRSLRGETWIESNVASRIYAPQSAVRRRRFRDWCALPFVVAPKGQPRAQLTCPSPCEDEAVHVCVSPRPRRKRRLRAGLRRAIEHKPPALSHGRIPAAQQSGARVRGTLVRAVPVDYALKRGAAIETELRRSWEKPRRRTAQRRTIGTVGVGERDRTTWVGRHDSNCSRPVHFHLVPTVDAPLLRLGSTQPWRRLRTSRGNDHRNDGQNNHASEKQRSCSEPHAGRLPVVTRQARMRQRSGMSPEQLPAGALKA